MVQAWQQREDYLPELAAVFSLYVDHIESPNRLRGKDKMLPVYAPLAYQRMARRNDGPGHQNCVEKIFRYRTEKMSGANRHDLPASEFGFH